VGTGSVPERLVRAVEQLAIAPADRVLEIGCGRGVAVSLVCARLDRGRIVAIDRSATMVRLALQRNTEHIAAGRASIHHGEVDSTLLAGERFDKVFAVNVNLFWTGPAARELAAIRRLLRPGGALYLCYEPPVAARAAELAEKLVAELGKHGFAATTTITPTGGSAVQLSVVARPEPASPR
jgi:SAM-dependent methyltransferase